jgi:putative glutamine amidotransferase
MHSKSPKIGITLSETGEKDSYRWPTRKRFDYIKREYYEAILAAGGMPILLPNADPPSAIDASFNELNGLLFTGGGDLHPKYYLQAIQSDDVDPDLARDNFEMELLARTLAHNLPILAICRGHQVLNVALGGTLFQDLTCLPFKAQPHADPQQTGTVFHDVTIDSESRLYAVIGEEMIQTNSSHHQVVDRLGRGLKAVAYAPDGVIEAIEHTDHEFVIGVQWHPEGIADRTHSQKLFKSLIEHARRLM